MKNNFIYHKKIKVERVTSASRLTEYEKKKEDDRVAQEEKEALVEEELSYIYEDDDADMTETENVEMSADKDVLSNRSGLMHHDLETEDVVTRQEIRKQKNLPLEYQ